MSTLTNVLEREVRRAEETAAAEHALQQNRLTHHLMPPAGWLNDPNGLCYYKGRYHVFFQYSPFDPEGGLKFWGHYSSEDLVNWVYEGTALYPDSVDDCHGVYSGSALVEDDAMHLFFSGNVKLEGDYDYINDGRRSSTLHVVSRDGKHFEKKEVAISCEKYPEDYTCHIRDPKVWKEEESYHMILGGRKKNDQGAVLFYQSQDLKNWTFSHEITTKEPFGYMWECPDLFTLSDTKILSVSPQGLIREDNRFQNIYASGYFLMEKDTHAEDFQNVDLQTGNFQEWDMGFDFYAPQTFLDEKNRRILIGWMGMPDAQEEYINPTAKEEHWQHCLTVPRELTLKNNRLYQYPVEEINGLRGEKIPLNVRKIKNPSGNETTLLYSFRSESDSDKHMAAHTSFDLELQVRGESASVALGNDLLLRYEDGKATITLSEKAGAGRTKRNAVIPSGKLEEIRILADTTAVEVYLNHGEVVFSTRFYPDDQPLLIEAEADQVEGRLFRLNRMHVVM